MKNPLFAASFTSANPGLAATLKAAMAGDTGAAAAGDMDTLLDTKMAELLNNPELAAAALLNVLDDMSAEEKQALLDCINNGITTALTSDSANENISTNLKTNIMDSVALLDNAKIASAAGMTKKPVFLNTCIKEALTALDPNLLKSAMSALLSCDPALMASIADKAALEALGLSPEDMKQALLKTMDNEDARKVMVEQFIAKDIITDANCGDIVTKVDNDDTNKVNASIQAIMQPINSSADGSVVAKASDLDAICSCDPPSLIPESVKSDLGSFLETLSDEQLADMLSSCMNDPLFAQAFKDANADLLSQMDEKKGESALGTSPGDLLKGLQLSDEEKKQILKNACENPDFGKAVSQISADILDDPAALSASIEKMKTAIEESGNQEAIDELARLESV
mmetsp:Transcript_10117/g.8865  ORF Transcript_10117/g.8865 Transcript_10117/m.8865 type:complete len:399 (-) Transcript_10117:2112-3308(-)